MMRFRNGSGIVRLVVILTVGAAAVIILRRFIFPMIRLSAQAAGAALVLSPICIKLEKHMRRGAACVLSGITASVLLLAITALIPVFAAVLYDFTGDIFSSFPQFVESAKDRAADWGIDLSQSGADIPEKIITTASKAYKAVSSTVSGAVGLIISLAAAVFILRDRERILLHFEMVFPIAIRKRVMICAAQAYDGFMLYLKAQFKISFCVGLLSAAALMMAGIPYAFLLGIMAGIFNVIPYLGPVIAAIPVTISALSVSLPLAVIAILIMLAVQQVDGLIISPRIMGNVTGFPSAVIMVALYCAGAAFGIAGMLLVLPCAILIRTCVRVFVESGRNC